MQKLQPLHRSVIMKMSESRSFSPSGGWTGFLLGLVGVHGFTPLAGYVSAVFLSSLADTCTATLLTGGASKAAFLV